MKKQAIYAFLLSFLIFQSCKKDVVIERNQEGVLTDIFANIEGSGPDRLFEPRYSGDTIYFDIPYFYPIESDFETDLSKIIVRATISSDAKVSTKFGEPMDLSKPLDFSIISGAGVEKRYTIIAKKVGDVSVSAAEISFEQDGSIQTIDGILVDNELRFFVEPGLDMSQTTITFGINKHATSSIESGSVIDLNIAQTLTISAPGDVHKDYKIVLMEPVKLPYGFGINRRMWLKLGAEFEFSGTNEQSIAVSGDYLIITRALTGGKAQFSVYNRFTGEYIREMKMPFSAGSGALSATRQLVADEKGHLLAINYATWGQTLQVYKYDDPFDDNPELIINTVNNQPGTTSGSVGIRLNVTGDLDQNAVIVTPVSSTRSFYRWEISNGTVVSQSPSVVTITGTAGSSHGLRPEIQYINPSVTSNYLLGFQNDFSYINGSSNQQINAVSLEGKGNITFMNAVAIGRFNNATYAFLGKYLSNYNLNRMAMSMFDVTNPQMLATQTSSSLYPSFNVFNSEILASGVTTAGTGDIAVGYSHDGDRMQVYMLHTGYGVWAHEFTVYSPN